MIVIEDVEESSLLFWCFHFGGLTYGVMIGLLRYDTLEYLAVDPKVDVLLTVLFCAPSMENGEAILHFMRMHRLRGWIHSHDYLVCAPSRPLAVDLLEDDVVIHHRHTLLAMPGRDGSLIKSSVDSDLTRLADCAGLLSVPFKNAQTYFDAAACSEVPSRVSLLSSRSEYASVGGVSGLCNSLLLQAGVLLARTRCSKQPAAKDIGSAVHGSGSALDKSETSY